MKALRKALRYLLIVMSLVSVLSIKAQSTAQLPQAQMQSTSVMVGSGSALPQAAATGAYVTGTTVGTYSPAKIHPGHMRKDVGDGDGGSTEEDGDPDNPGEPFPVGDAAWPLLALAAAYAVLRVYRRKRSV